MVDGAIKVGTGIDLSGIKSDIKKLEGELTRAQKEVDKLTQKAEKIKEPYDDLREINNKSKGNVSKDAFNEHLDQEEAKALAQVTAQREALNKQIQEYNNQLEQANAKLREQNAIISSGKELESTVKAGSVLDKITTQEQYNSLLEQTRAKMAAVEDAARKIAEANGVSYESLLKASPTYQKLSDTMDILTSTTKEFKKESEDAGDAARKAFSFAKKESDRLNASIKKGIQKIGRMAVAVLGVRGAYSLVRRAVDACLNSNEELANKMTAIWNTLGTIIEPVVELMINGVYKILAYINYFIKAITGIDFVAMANAKALSKQAAATDKLAKSTKEATRALAGFDEMNVLQDTSSSSLSSTGSTSSAVSVPTLELPELTEKEKAILDEIVVVFNRIRDAIEEVKIKCSELKDWWNTLDESTQKLIMTLGIAGLVGALIGGVSVLGAVLAVIGVITAFNLLLSGESTDTLNAFLILLGVAGLVGILVGGKAGFTVAGAIAVVAGAITAFNLLLTGETTDALDAFIILLGVAGLVGILVGGAKGVTVAASIAAVSAVITSFNLLINGDTTDAIAGLILLLGGAGLAGYLWGGVKGVAVGIAVASVISILNAFNKLLNGDTSDALEAVIQIITGAAGLIFAFNALKAMIEGKAGVSAVLTALGNPLFLVVAGFAVLAAGILYLSENWSKMNGAQKAITILTSLAAAAAAAAIAIAIFHTSWTVGIAAAAIAAGVALLGLTFSFAGGSTSKLTESGQSMAQGFYNSSNFNGSALPKLAQGGIVNRPGRGVPAIVGEAGAEAVLPLENNTEWMDILADKIGGNVTIPIMLDGRKIATYVVDIQKKKAFAMNGA